MHRPWWRRRRFAIGAISEAGADIVGLQEAHGGQVRDIVRALPRYSAIGRGRLRWRFGERCAILVDRSLPVTSSGTFWLSEHPDRPGSKSWDASMPRICTWVATGSSFAVFNVHLDHRGPHAREKGAALVAARALELGLPSVVMGDLNARAGSPTLRVLHTAGFREAASAGVDHILCTEHWDVSEAGVVGADPRASDHAPLVCVLSSR